ncbi:MAG: anaerobic ribonucleoside-triphosphate reductase activating protein [Eubacteriales bacterium]|nr:anaerobic ribonucleoside-triphosphate reductase activating protein [Eubacteriales bacterium]
MRIAGIMDDSIVDGPGLRLTVFAQGCVHDCPGCHNPESHDRNGGKEMSVEEIVEMIDDNPLLDGVTLSGGDPFCQSEPCAQIASAAKERGLSVWTYSGWTYEQLLRKAEQESGVRALLENTDVLVDGPFVLAQRSLEVKWRGSKNQRLIDVRRSLDAGEAVEIEG